MLTMEQFAKWNKEADEIWARRIARGAERPHPAVELHAKLAFRRGYLAAMAKVAREKALSS